MARWKRWRCRRLGESAFRRPASEIFFRQIPCLFFRQIAGKNQRGIRWRVVLLPKVDEIFSCRRFDGPLGADAAVSIGTICTIKRASRNRKRDLDWLILHL